MDSARDLPRLGPLRLPESAPIPALLRRIGLAGALILMVVLVLWIDRDGLRDHANNGEPQSGERTALRWGTDDVLVVNH